MPEHTMSELTTKPARADWSRLIRPLSARDSPAVVAHFKRLDGTARQSRFGYDAPPAAIEAYAANVGRDLGATIGTFPDETLRGLIEMRPVNAGSRFWEAVVSVEPEWQGRGIGLALSEQGLQAAGAGGAQRVYLRCSAGNLAARHLLAKLSRSLREVDGDVVAAIEVGTPGGGALRPGRPAPGKAGAATG